MDILNYIASFTISKIVAGILSSGIFAGFAISGYGVLATAYKQTHRYTLKQRYNQVHDQLKYQMPLADLFSALIVADDKTPFYPPTLFSTTTIKAIFGNDTTSFESLCMFLLTFIVYYIVYLIAISFEHYYSVMTFNAFMIYNIHRMLKKFYIDVPSIVYNVIVGAI